MGIIAALPGLFAAIVAMRRSPAAAFLKVYIPVLLLLPEYYRWIVPVLPDPTFSQAAIIPIVVVFFLRERHTWKFSVMDFFMLGFAFFVGYSEYANAGYKEAQNLMFDMLGWVLFPYVAAKALIEPKGLRVQFARRFATLLFAVSVLSLYEFKMGTTPWQIVFNRFFPGQADGWVTTFRYGFTRIAGPYGHAILAGLVLVVGYRISRWLEWSGLWEPNFGLSRLPLSKARIIMLGLLAGCIMTLVRGPWLGGLIGAAVTGVGRAKNRRKALLLLSAAIVFIALPAAAWFYSYASVGRANAHSDSQETAAYRKELIDKYVDIVLTRSALGWGRNTWPKVSGMQSIDNYYLLLALMHGLIAAGLLVAIIATMVTRLIRFEMKRPAAGQPGSSLGFTLAAIYVVYAVTIATVYMGLTVIPLFAVITGWAEGYLLSTPSRSPIRVIVRSTQFRRVLA